MDGFVPARVSDVVLAKVPQDFLTFIRDWGAFMTAEGNLVHWTREWTFTIVIGGVVLLFLLIKGLGLTIMGRWTPVAGNANRPPDIIRCNDSLWQFYSPPEGSKVAIDIIFFHGLQLGNFENAFWTTWLARNDETLVWPKEYLKNRYPAARIFSVSYNSSVIRRDGQLDMYALGENLVSDIILNADLDIGTRPVILVGHSLGGLVIKQLIISAIQMKTKVESPSRINAFLENFKGVFYYATPHQGSNIANLARHIPLTSPILELLKTLDTNRGRINADFMQYRKQLKATAGAMAESLPTYYKLPYSIFGISIGFGFTVVEEASARHDIDASNYYTGTESDHITVCKAENERSSVVVKLTQFIATTLDARTLADAEAPRDAVNLQ
ncbi:unnamed protein product [Calypogeia fissa]